MEPTANNVNTDTEEKIIWAKRIMLHIFGINDVEKNAEIQHTYKLILDNPLTGLLFLAARVHSIPSLHQHPIVYTDNINNCKLCGKIDKESKNLFRGYKCQQFTTHISELEQHEECDFQCCTSCYVIDAAVFREAFIKCARSRVEYQNRLPVGILQDYAKIDSKSQRNPHLRESIKLKYNVDPDKLLFKAYESIELDPIYVGAELWLGEHHRLVNNSYDKSKIITNTILHKHQLIYNNALDHLHKCDVCLIQLNGGYRCQECDFDICISCTNLDK